MIRADELLAFFGAAAAENEHLVLAMSAAVMEAEELDHRTLPRPGKTNQTGRPKYSESTWGRMMERDIEQLRIPGSSQARVFRTRFRVPFGLFELIVSWTTAWVASKRKSETDCSGRPAVPVSLLVLGVLRMLGRGTCTDGINELSDISETTMMTFFKSFCKYVTSQYTCVLCILCCLFFFRWFRETVYPVWVHPPRNPAELAKAMGPYCAVGLNGAFSSSDVIHIHWGRFKSK